jgi:RimJ/RimL family protein N-acetyltransferase
MGKSVLNLSFQKVREIDLPCLKTLLPELGKFYDGHENSRFFDQLVNKEKHDSNGYFTLKKEIWIARDHEDQCCGFICLNYKRGNTVKIGPIIVNPANRGQGVGKFLIKSSLEKLNKESVRKVYATTSSENTPATDLFKKSGFRLEVELPEQYRKGNKELIWGYFFDFPKEIFVNENSLLQAQVIEKASSLKTVNFDPKADSQHLKKVISVIKEWHEDIDSSFAEQIIKASERGLDFETKGKLILTIKDQDSKFCGLAIAAPKRGGAVKVYPLYGVKNALHLLVEALKSKFKHLGYRKLYTFSHANDEKYIEALTSLGFTLRGDISSPYKSGHDLAVLDLFI